MSTHPKVIGQTDRQEQTPTSLPLLFAACKEHCLRCNATACLECDGIRHIDLGMYHVAVTDAILEPDTQSDECISKLIYLIGYPMIRYVLINLP